MPSDSYRAWDDPRSSARLSSEFERQCLRFKLAGTAPLTRLECFLSETFRSFVEIHGETDEPIDRAFFRTGFQLALLLAISELEEESSEESERLVVIDRARKTFVRMATLEDLNERGRRFLDDGDDESN